MSVCVPTSVSYRALLTSHGGIDGVGVNGGVGSGTGALRSDEAGEHRNGNS